MPDLNMQWVLRNETDWKDSEAAGLARAVCNEMRKPDAGMFLIGGEFQSAISSAVETPAELPPLPFPHMTMDIDSERTLSFALGNEGRSLLHVDIHGFFVRELKQGEQWEVIALCVLVEEDSGIERTSFLVYDVGMSPDSLIKGKEKSVYIQQFPQLRSWVVEMAHLVTAKNIEHVPATRQVRRNLQRKMGVSHPVQSFTILQRSTTASTSGIPNGRQYHCRWIVRGHWRTYQSGTRTWIAAHIKGKPGAPWRSIKPLYVREPESA